MSIITNRNATIDVIRAESEYVAPVCLMAQRFAVNLYMPRNKLGFGIAVALYGKGNGYGN